MKTCQVSPGPFCILRVVLGTKLVKSGGLSKPNEPDQHPLATAL